MAASYDPERGSAPTFIFTIARRLAIDLYRRPSSRAANPESPPPPEDDRVDAVLARLEVREAMNSISDAHREILELSYVHDLKQAEIAERLGIPLGTVKTRSHHALRSLKSVLQQRGFND